MGSPLFASVRCIAAALALVGCGSDGDTSRDGTSSDTTGDTPPTDTASADTSERDTLPGDTVPPETADSTPDTTPDTTPDSTPDTAGDTTSLPPYIDGCESLFAARVAEKQIALDVTFPADCDAPLRDPIAALRAGGKPLCRAGESPNACRTRHYETPPALADLPGGCLDQGAPAGCLRGKWVPRCADGGDACAEPEAVCQDGTRPMIYAEAATSGASSAWLFHIGGEGGPCVGAKCWYNYRFVHLEDGDIEFEQAMSTLHPDHGSSAATTGRGITNGTVLEQNPFARLNRVRFERCTDVASTAIELVPFGDGVPAELAAQFPDLPIATRGSVVPTWHHGLATWLATLHSLTTSAGRDLDGDGEADLPSLADASMVILAGASDASEWLVFAADRLAEELRAIAGADVDVRIMIDGHFAPSLDNEGRYHPEAPAPYDIFRDRYGVTGLCRLPDNGDGLDNEACSDGSYQPDGGLAMSYARRGVIRDASCEAMHGADAPECRDRPHTLLNHVATPFLVLADQEDNTVSDAAPFYGDDNSYHWDEPATYRQRVLDQAHDIAAFWGTSAREEGAGAEGDAVLILPKARREGQPWGRATHVRFHSDAEMVSGMTLCSPEGVALQTVAFGSMIGGWIAGELPVYFAMEDAGSWDGASPYWVTGGVCRAPE